MGNCHTVGPNEALVVSGNVNDRQRCVSAPRVRSCLVELEEGFTGEGETDILMLLSPAMDLDINSWR